MNDIVTPSGLIINQFLRGDYNVVPSSVRNQQGDVLWSWATCNKPWNCFGQTFLLDDEYVIAIRSSNKIFEVIRVDDLPKIKRVRVGNRMLPFGQSSIDWHFETKVTIADSEGLAFSVAIEEEPLYEKIKIEREAAQKVEKDGNNKCRLHETEVFVAPPKKFSSGDKNTQEEELGAEDMFPVTIGGKTRNVLVFPTRGHIRKLIANGFPVGTWVGHQEDQDLTIYVLTAEGFNILKEFKQKPERFTA